MNNHFEVRLNNWFEQHLFDCQKAKKQHEERIAYYNEQIATTEEFLKNLIVADGGNYWHWSNELLSRYQLYGHFVYSVGYRFIERKDQNNVQWYFTNAPDIIIAHTKGFGLTSLKKVCEDADEKMRETLEKLNK